jgi:hypothetical protein
VFADLDNDGDLDLFVVNGGSVARNVPDTLYENLGDGTFTDATAAAGIGGPEAGRGVSVLALDYDSDGDLDLYVTNGGGSPPGNEGPRVLWRNDTPAGAWASVDLRGTSSNRFGLGTRVVHGTRVLERHALTGRASASLLPMHLGLGRARSAALDVRWPSGRQSRVVVRAGESLLLVEPGD